MESQLEFSAVFLELLLSIRVIEFATKQETDTYITTCFNSDTEYLQHACVRFAQNHATDVKKKFDWERKIQLF